MQNLKTRPHPRGGGSAQPPALVHPPDQTRGGPLSRARGRRSATPARRPRTRHRRCDPPEPNQTALTPRPRPERPCRPGCRVGAPGYAWALGHTWAPGRTWMDSPRRTGGHAPSLGSEREHSGARASSPGRAAPSRWAPSLGCSGRRGRWWVARTRGRGGSAGTEACPDALRVGYTWTTLDSGHLWTPLDACGHLDSAGPLGPLGAPLHATEPDSVHLGSG